MESTQISEHRAPFTKRQKQAKAKFKTAQQTHGDLHGSICQRMFGDLGSPQTLIRCSVNGIKRCKKEERKRQSGV